MASASSERGIDGLAHRSSSVTSQAWLKTHMWAMPFMGLDLIDLLPFRSLATSFCHPSSLHWNKQHPLTREVEGSPGSVTSAFRLVKLVFGCALGIMCHIISLRSADEVSRWRGVCLPS